MLTPFPGFGKRICDKTRIVDCKIKKKKGGFTIDIIVDRKDRKNKTQSSILTFFAYFAILARKK